LEGIYTLWGIVGAVAEAGLLTLLLRSTFPRGHRATLCFCLPLLAAVLWVCGTDYAPAWAAALARLLLYPVFALTCFGGRPIRRSLWGLGVALLTICCTLLCGIMLDAVPTYSQAEGLNRSLFRFSAAYLPLLLFAGLTLALSRSRSAFRGLSARENAVILGLALLCAAVLLLLRRPETAKLAEASRAWIACIVFLLLLGAGALIAMLGSDRERLAAAEAEAAALRREKQYNEDLIRISDSVRQIKHDYANHMNVIAALTREGDLEKLRQYMSDYHAEYGAVDHYAVTGEPFLDALLASKLMACEARQIPVRLVAFGWGKTGLSEVELVSLFGNLIDNAANACAVLPAAKREIKITCKRKARMLSLCVSNTTDGLVPEEALSGGLGLPRIRSIVAAHNGIFNLRRENGLFTVDLLLPAIEEGSAHDD
jgi:hypothetical protein